MYIYVPYLSMHLQTHAELKNNKTRSDDYGIRI